MNTKVFKFLIYVSVIAILAVIAGQFLWTQQTHKLITRNARNVIELALTKTANDFNQYFHYKKNMIADTSNLSEKHLMNVSANIPEMVPALDSILKVEFSNIGLQSNYKLALIHQGVFLYKSDESIADSVYQKDSFNKSLYCGFSNHGISMSVFFPEGYVVRSDSPHMRAWWLISLVGFVIIVLSGSFLFRSIMKIQTESGRRIRIINNLAHEFKTPLASIKLASEMLMNEQIINQPNRVHRYGELLQFEVRRLQFQGEQILNMALLEEGQIMLKFEYVSANEVIRKLVENYLVVRSDLAEQLTTNLHSDNDIVYVDLGHFQNVISNLIENSFKYGGDGVKVEINTGNNSNGVLIHVIDNGIGIARKYHKVVFERFYRITSSNRHDIKGHGIGLYYVKNILSKMGARVTLTSAPNKGARFEMFFPFEHN